VLDNRRTVQTTPLPQLHVFLTVARHRSFSGAARELGVSTSAVSQAVKQLEEQLTVKLLTRTTRSVSPTDAGRRLVESAGPGLRQAISALHEASAEPGEVGGRVRISVGRGAVPFVITPVLPVLRERHPRVQIEVVIESRFVDIVGEGYDAGVRLAEALERDMIQVRLTEPFRFVVVGSPEYLAKRGVPRRPEDLLKHDCLTFRGQTSGQLYAWELERGRKSWRVPVRGGIVAEAEYCVTLAEMGLGLAYMFEPFVADQLRDGTLQEVLEPFAPSVPGFFLYYPSRAQSSPALRLFVEVAKEVLMPRARRLSSSV
jgi:DNA-binding transcriptional LysR family regulator